MHSIARLLLPLSSIGLAAALASCGGGGGSSPAPGEPPPAVKTLTAIQGPECIADTSGRWVTALTQAQGDAPAGPGGKFFMAVRYVHAIDTPITSNFGHLGGLPVTNYDPEAGSAAKDYGRWQRGKVDGNASATSGFQMKCDDAGSYIDTATFARQSIVGAGPHSAYFYDFRDPADALSLVKLPAAFGSDADTDLVLQARVEVPSLQRSGPPDNPPTGALAIAQLSLGAYLRDTVSGKLFAYAVMIYQNAPQETPQVAQDEEVAYVSTPTQTNEFITMSADSAGYSSDTWSGLRLYRVHIPRAKFAHALTRVNAFCAAPENRERPFCRPGADNRAFSLDPANYQLVAFGMLHEVFNGPDHRIASGVHYKEVGAYRAR
jgi:hypothetical protein